jgi:hypothetical protein
VNASGLNQYKQLLLAKRSELLPATVGLVRMGYGRSFDIGTFGSIFGHTVTQTVPSASAVADRVQRDTVHHRPRTATKLAAIGTA